MANDHANENDEAPAALTVRELLDNFEALNAHFHYDPDTHDRSITLETEVDGTPHQAHLERSEVSQLITICADLLLEEGEKAREHRDNLSHDEDLPLELLDQIRRHGQP